VRTDNYFAGQFLTLPGVNLYFIDTKGTGVPLVLLHANIGTIQSWREQVEPFVKAGFRVIAFDRRGWGESQIIESSGLQPGSIAEDLDALMSHLNIQKFHLLGIAGGGFAALDYASWQSAKLSKLVIAASNGQFKEPVMQSFYDRIAIPGLTGNQELRVFLEVGVSYRAENPKGLEAFSRIEHGSRQPNAPPQLMRTPNTFAKISKISIPTLLIAGGADLLAPPSLMKLWGVYLVNSDFVLIPDAGHAMNWERPLEFNTHVIQFLKTNL